jgi:hypothetical protein
LSEDSSLFVYDIQQDVKAPARRELEKLPFADEVLVTKIDLEEKKARCVCVQLHARPCQAVCRPCALIARLQRPYTLACMQQLH